MVWFMIKQFLNAITIKILTHRLSMVKGSWFMAHHFGTLGASWNTMEEAGRTQGGPDPDFHCLLINFESLC